NLLHRTRRERSGHRSLSGRWRAVSCACAKSGRRVHHRRRLCPNLSPSRRGRWFLRRRACENMTMTPQVTVDDIGRAAERIKTMARRTPLERSRWLSSELGGDVWLKLDCLQLTGSFKLRGAMAKLTRLTETEKARGVLTVSAGNHGLAVAHCAEA